MMGLNLIHVIKGATGSKLGYVALQWDERYKQNICKTVII